MNRLQKYALKIIGVGAILGVGLNLGPASAAENVILKYGMFYRSVPVESLTGYSKTQQATGGLASLLRSVSDDDRSALLKLLNARFPFGVLQVDQILKSPVGAEFLNDVAGATHLPGNDDEAEVKALRSAAIVTAAADKSLSFSGMLERYPTENLTINLPVLLKTLKGSKALGQLVQGGLQNVAPPPTNLP